MKVSLFVTCLGDQLFPKVGVATVRVLRRLGCEVDFPEAQICCGQPAFNSGRHAEARRVARSLLDAFEGSEYVVAPSGSCVGMIRHYYAELFAGDAELAARARAFAAKTYELSQFLVQVLGVEDLGGRFAERVTYHASCHGSRLLGVRDEPIRLISNLDEVDFVPLRRCEDCCGFGGTFSVKLADVSGAMVDEKVDHIVETGADYVVSTDMGCLMNIAGRLARRNLPIYPLHLAELLERACLADSELDAP